VPPTVQRQSSLLIAFAAPREGDAIVAGLGGDGRAGVPLWRAVAVAPGLEVVHTGVGPAAAAAGLARAFEPARHSAILSLGVGGALPGPDAAELGSVLLATRSVFADLGLQTPEGFCSIGEMGFSLAGSGEGYAPEARLLGRLSPLSDRRAPVATVSTCSGTDALAAAVRDRLGDGGGLGAEAMEGASAGLVAEMLGVPFAEIRVISNTTGDRSAQRWDLDGALERLARVARGLAGLDLTTR